MRVSIFLIAVLTVAANAPAQYYDTTPDWQSSDTLVGTGGALVDLDNDGWLDFVVANGNDMAQQRVTVYYNKGITSVPAGRFPLTPDWQSADLAYNGHLSVADVNGDGWMDVAVAHLGNAGTIAPIAKLYLNNSGVLSTTPDWSANISGNAFGVAFGDMNGDGRPDLAVATGWAYTPQRLYKNCVYLNIGGTLASTASWQSADTGHLQGVLWVDADDDGLLDLVGAANGARNRMYRNVGGILQTTASWLASDVTTPDSIMAVAGDVNGDGAQDLFIADNNQLGGGSGRFRQYDGINGGTFATTASWTYFEGYCSAVELADIDADGYLDLATGGWWRPVRIFQGDGTGFGATSDYTSSESNVVEKIVFGDINRDGVTPAMETFPANGGQKLFYLAQRHIQELLAVEVDGVALSPTQYTFSREDGWISLGAAPIMQLVVSYRYSTKLDMAVTHWDNDVGNYAYYNNAFVAGDANCDGAFDVMDVEPFVLLLLDAYAFGAQYPGCDAWTSCDMNDDQHIDGRDIAPFVGLLLP